MLDFLIFAVTVVVALIAAVIYLYPGSRKVTTVPGLEPSSPADGNLGDVARAGTVHDFLTKLHEDFGDIASFWWGTQLVVSVASPILVKETSGMFDRPKLLFESYESIIGMHSMQYKNGGSGRKFHSKSGSVYSFDMMHQYIPLVCKLAHELAEKLKSVPQGEHVPLQQYMFALAIKMICRASFGNWFEDDKEVVKIHRAYEKCMGELERRVTEGNPGLESVQERQFQESKKVLETCIFEAYQLRKKKLVRDENKILLDVLMEICESEEEIIGNAITYLIGGFHATGALLTWSIYFLATHEDVQEKVYNEMIGALGKEELTNSTVEDLPYLRQVLNETLRCSQLAPWAARVQDFDGEIGGHKIPAGTPVIVALGCLHHREDLWPEPEKFDPDRFLEENMKSKPAHAFEPFGFSGKRKCPGYRFSLTEATTVLSILVREFKFELVEGQVVTPFHWFVTKPTEEVWITVNNRK